MLGLVLRSPKKPVPLQRINGTAWQSTTFIGVADWPEGRQLNCNAESLTKESHLSEEISISDANGKCIHGNYEIANGAVTVTTAKGLSRTADVDENMLSPETLARMLLLQLHKREDPDQ